MKWEEALEVVRQNRDATYWSQLPTAEMAAMAEQIEANRKAIAELRKDIETMIEGVSVGKALEKIAQLTRDGN
jgi:hypothetical protein